MKRKTVATILPKDIYNRLEKANREITTLRDLIGMLQNDGVENDIVSMYVDRLKVANENFYDVSSEIAKFLHSNIPNEIDGFDYRWQIKSFDGTGRIYITINEENEHE